MLLLFPAKKLNFVKSSFYHCIRYVSLLGKNCFLVFVIVPGNDAEICQIAATDGLDEFSVYAFPQNGISPEASAVNKLSIKHETLLYDGRPVVAVEITDALVRFMNWLKRKPLPCVLVAHNAKRFDAKHLIKAVESCDKMEEFSQIVIGFSDTLLAFRDLFPERKSCSQENLAKDLLNTTYDAHNALNDARTLQRLRATFISDELLVKHSFTLPWFQEYVRFLNQKKQNLDTLRPLITCKVLSQDMAKKAAASGLSFEHMHSASQRGGMDGLSRVLEEKVEDKPRVTSKREIITRIFDYFQNISVS